MANLDSFILSSADIESLEAPAFLQALPQTILAKINSARIDLSASYIIDKTLYDAVYITSDIHADLEKLDTMLTNAGLVVKTPKAETAQFSEYAKIVCDSQWVAKRTLLIIIGDVVDGRRVINNNTQNVPDAKGNVELMLHAYLYNLRIQARGQNSEIRFTIGNHDFHSVIKSTTWDLPNFYDSYVHRTARQFFGTRNGRRKCLFPFYECCPYLMLSLSNEIACIHAGFTVYTRAGAFVDNTVLFQTMQKQIDANGTFGGLDYRDIDILSAIHVWRTTEGYEGSPLWSRFYAMMPKSDVCSIIDANYTMVVVGHCMTSGSHFKTGVHGSEIISDALYTKYNCAGEGGCVLIGCENASGPHLAFVDIGMSRAFYPTKPLVSRAEILLLTHDDSLDDARYFNTIVRRNVGGDGSANEVVWKAALKQRGGRLRKSLRKKRKSKRQDSKRYNRRHKKNLHQKQNVRKWV